MAEVASAYVSLIPSAKGFASGVVKETDKAATTAGKSFGGKFAGSVKGILGGALAGLGVTKLISDSLSEAREAQKVGALTTQVIKSTGGAANVTAKQVGDLATAISNKVGVDDEAIQSGENMLLTFKNIRNEAGKGNDIFTQATKTTTDLAAAMAAASGGELNFRSASIQMGKALNDPVKGITALSRVGVTFTDQQKAQIKALVASGNTMKAQKIILKELKSEFGGAAAAQATAGDKARVAWKNLEEQIGTALLPVVDDLANRLTKDVVPAVSEFITEMQNGTGNGGQFVDVLKETVGVGKDIVHFFDSLPGPVKKYGAELLIAAIALNKVNNLFRSGRSSITGWLDSLGPADAKMSKTSKGLYAIGVGIRNIAGAGGAIALTKSVHESNLAMAGLERVGGGIATGFAVGGPVGAAISGTTGLLWTLKDAFSTNAKTVKVSLPTYKEYGSTLDGVKAKITAATREMVFQRLEQSGLLDATRKLGLSDREAVNAMLGNTTARTHLATALRTQTGLTKEQRTALENETGAVAASRLAQLKHNIAIAGSKEELQKARTALRNFMAEPASKRLSIQGVEEAKAALGSLKLAIAQVWGAAKAAHVAGSGGLDVLLNPGHKATGGPVVAGQPYIVGERQPELFVPNQSGRIIPKVPMTTSGSTSVDNEQTAYRAMSRALANSNVVIMSKSNLDALDLLVGTA
jgi:hypothetical protein